MLDFNNLKIYTTVLLLWVTTQFSFEYENYLACFLVLTFGLLHGSNDINLIQKANSKKINPKKIILRYLTTILIGIIAFITVPKLMIIVFILLSSFHFGEQHFSKKIVKANRVISLFYTFYGLIIFFLLFSIHNNEVLTILKKITSVSINASFLNNSLLCVSIVTILLYLYITKNRLIKVNLYQELFFLLLFLIIFKNATLLWSFSIYFIIWHSVPSLNDQMFHLYGIKSKQNIVKYLKSSFLYWLISLISVIVITIVFYNDESKFYLITIATLFSVTCPHIFVMNKIGNK